MKRILSLVLDDEGFISLKLMQDEAVKIDEFTTKNFEDSEQIREYYKDKIDKYLEDNRSYIEAVSKSSGKYFRGRIVILEPYEFDGSLYFSEKRVLYKKHLVAFKKMVQDKKTMLSALRLEKLTYNKHGIRRIFTPFLVEKIKNSNYKVISQVNIIKKEIKKNNFFNILRLIIKAYESERKNRQHLETIEAIYKKYKQNKEKQNNLKETNEENLDGSFYNINGFLYSCDDIPFDLDELRKMDTDFIPDGLGGSHERKR